MPDDLSEACERIREEAEAGSLEAQRIEDELNAALALLMRFTGYAALPPSPWVGTLMDARIDFAIADPDPRRYFTTGIITETLPATPAEPPAPPAGTLDSSRRPRRGWRPGGR